MSFLARPQRGKSPPIPMNVNEREDMTLAQKKRIAVWATMGLIPGENRQPDLSPPRYRPRSPPKGGTVLPNKRALLLEREKKLREQQDKEEQPELEEQQRRFKKRAGGMQSLGVVMPREEVKVSFIGGVPREGRSAPSAPEPDEDDDDDDALEAGPVCSCGKRFRPGAKFCSECGAKNDAVAFTGSASEMVSSILRKEREAAVAPAAFDVAIKEGRQRAEKAKQQAPKPDQKRKKAKKKKRKSARESDEDEDESDDLDDDDRREEEGPKLTDEERRMAREGGAYRNMVVPSVKGMVSNDYKGFTDADLERRFATHQSSSDAGLMSEKEAMALVRREKSDKGNISGAKRVQRELAEWQNKKRERMARRSRSREHLVVGRK